MAIKTATIQAATRKPTKTIKSLKDLKTLKHEVGMVEPDDLSVEIEHYIAISDLYKSLKRDNESCKKTFRRAFDLKGQRVFHGSTANIVAKVKPTRKINSEKLKAFLGANYESFLEDGIAVEFEVVPKSV